MRHLEAYRGIVSDAIIADLYERAALLRDRHVVHMNSTTQGGGVAEILHTLVPLMNDVGVACGWRVLVGTPDFFDVTKAFHNGLQGESIGLTEQMKVIHAEVNENFSAYTHLGGHDAVIIHDPQPLPMIRFAEKCQPWIWRCHIDLTEPDPELWEYLKTDISKYDLMIVSHEQYLRPDLDVEQRIIHPAIDPLSHKNISLSEEVIGTCMSRYDVPLDKPLITQVSRFDKWKDPEGVIEVFKRVLERVDCRLVLAGNLATDDPEGIEVYEHVKSLAAPMIESGQLIMLIGANDIEINALQRVSSVILQKSLSEGFGLTVSEAMWKQTPVVAGRVGGIPLQVIDGETGLLVDPTDFDQCADRVVTLLTDRPMAEEMARKGKEYVREHFLITRLLADDLELLHDLIGD